jgi:hypothetical protein
MWRSLPVTVVFVMALFSPRGGWATSGGDSHLRILGWSAAHATLFVRYTPGGEWEMAELWAYNLKEQVLEKAECDTCLQMSPAPPQPDEDESLLSPTERGHLRVLRKAKSLAKLEVIDPKDAAAAGLSFRCEEPARRRCEDDVRCYRHTCILAVADGEPGRIEFDASSKRTKVRLFKIPDYPKAAIAWVIHQGLIEFGYREDKVLFVPAFKPKKISMRRFAAKYF